jgi:hypothetical protein
VQLFHFLIKITYCFLVFYLLQEFFCSLGEKMVTMKVTIDNQEVEVPDIRIRHIHGGLTAHSVNGFLFSLFVKDQNGRWLGWITKEDEFNCKNGLCNPAIK